MTGTAQVPTTKRFVLRLEPELHDAIAQWASDEHRSMNKQIAYVLQRALSERSRREQTTSSRVAD